MSRSLFPRVALLLFVAAVAAVVVLPTCAQNENPSAGRSTVHVPDPSSDGSWDGTWFHVSRDHRVAMWIRTIDGKPELRIQYFRVGKVEQFETDWTGSAEYRVDGAPGKFSIVLTEVGDDRLVGNWNWSLEFSDSGRTERSDVSIYRTGDGRQLTILFENFTLETRRGASISSTTTKKTWTFRKASKRHLLWDELPF